LAWGEGYALGPGWRSGLVEWMRGAKVLVHDAMYTESEYDAHRGWGHSTCDQAVELAVEAGVERLVLYHHNPDRTDGELDAMLAHCRKLVEGRGVRLSVDVAAEGMELIV
jgi:ribonuclease BN (tRNA processing enzyme)